MSGPLLPRSFPLAGPVDGRLPFALGDESVRDSLRNILLTRPGERLMRPEFGAGLQRFIHEPDHEATRRLIADVAKGAVQRFEPRIVLESVDVEPVDGRPATLRVALRYHLRHDGQVGVLTLPLELAP